MNKFSSVTFVILLLECAPSFACAKDKADKSEILICEKNYKIVSLDNEKELGSCHVKAISKEKKKEIEIVEQMNIGYRGKKAGWTSTVVYSCKPMLVPLSSTVETTIDGKACMKGTVTFSKDTLSISCVGLLNKRTGAPIEPPLKLEQRGILKPKGNILFQSAVHLLSPMYLQAKGELKDVVFVEFPDDIGAPELINWKEGYRLVREQAGEKGTYLMKLFAPHSDEPVWSIQFDKDDKVILMSCFGKMKFVEVDKKKK